MNVIITLPSDLIDAILDKKKSFEIRSRLPRNFDTQKDVVFVCQKGAKKVPLYFTILKFYTYTKHSDCNDYIAQKAAVPTQWIDNYMEEKDCIYAWVIGYVCELAYPVDVWHQLQMIHNPQSFIYTQYEWKKTIVHNCFVSTFITYSDMDKMFNPMKTQLKWLLQQKKAVQ